MNRIRLKKKKTTSARSLSDTLTIAVFFLFMLIPGIFYILLKPPAFLESERRSAEAMPEISLSSIYDKEYYEDFESFLLDAFFARDLMIRGKNLFSTDILMQTDVDGIMKTDDGVVKLLMECDKARISETAETFDRICSEYFQKAGGIYLSVIPGRSFYFSDSEKLCFEECSNTLDRKMRTPHSTVDLTGVLSQDSYYCTDIHWKQQKLLPVARLILDAMGRAFPPTVFSETELGEFTGTVGSQSHLCDETDILTIMTSEYTKKAEVSYLVSGESGDVYDTDAFYESYDKYDVFLRGETTGGSNNSFISIKTGNDKGRLIIFRDSFARSLAPLLLGSYSEIILIDLRAGSGSLERYADLLSGSEDTDVLFLVSAYVVNTTAIK